MQAKNETLAVDLLWGARAIAREAGLFDKKGEPDAHRATYLLRKGLLPGDRVGHIWTSTKSRLRAKFGGRP